MQPQRGRAPSYSAPAKYIWLDGNFVPWDEAKVHVRTGSFYYGANVFEGIRAYWNDEKQELYLVKLSEHLDRLFNSMKIFRMAVPFSKQEIFNAQVELLLKNEFKADVHSRPMAYVGVGDHFSTDLQKVYMGVCIIAMPRAQPDTLKTGVHCCVSSWERISDRTLPPRVKAGANYVNARLAIIEAKLNGYDEPILLNHEGKVTEGWGACLIMVRNGLVITPSLTSNILESITRYSLLGLFREELGVNTLEREVDRTELYLADELFFCGSGYEILPIVSVDRITIGDGQPGPLTRQIQDLYFSIGRGKHPKYADWLTPVYGR